MASLQVGGGGHGGKRPVDHDVPLVPFIDLLLCCVMFLLVTAVWNRLASVDSPLASPGGATAPVEERPTLTLLVSAERVTIGSDLGDRLELPRDEGLASLREALVARRAGDRDDIEVAVVPDDDLLHEDIIETVDAVIGSGYPNVGLRDR
jgi:biopolymer transport protein ExbD